ncbi:replication-relaxation family protein [Longispora albida]|uniref:replication-relaxation family protein n=1 Tax=Longispora albida TaxID=203523 RepID=UPI000377948A|nr:replication-relaxation family protein [Longispora albida]
MHSTGTHSTNPQPSSLLLHELADVNCSLMASDRWLFDLLHEHRVLTVSQLVRFGFRTTARDAGRRLRVLRSRQITASFDHVTPAGTRQRCWTLGVRGRQLTALWDDQAVPADGDAARLVTNQAADPGNNHALAIGEFFSRLAEGSRPGTFTDLRFWWGPRSCAALPAAAGKGPLEYGSYFSHGTHIGFWLHHPAPAPAALPAVIRGYQELAAATGTSTVLIPAASQAAEDQLWNNLAACDLTGLTIATTTSHPTGPGIPQWRTSPAGQLIPFSALPGTYRTDHPWWGAKPSQNLPPLPGHPIWDPEREYDEAVFDNWETCRDTTST